MLCRGKWFRTPFSAIPQIKDERYAETDLEKLLPPGWNPAEIFDGLKLDELSNDDPQAKESTLDFSGVVL